MMRKKLFFLFGIMLVLSLAGYTVCRIAKEEKRLYPSGQPGQPGQLRLVTSFYPMYILGRNLVQNAQGTVVENLTEHHTGCLHDYQLTAKDMKLLGEADALLINGAGMELFLEQIYRSYPELAVVTATQGIELLAGVEHHHEHAEHKEYAEHEEHAEHAEHEGHAEHAEHEGHEEHEGNGHVWMDVARYRIQAKQVCDALKKLNASQAEAYETSYSIYDRQLEQLEAEVAALARQTKDIPVVLFHEAYVYFADSLSMEILGVLALDSETVPSAGEIAEIIEEIRYHKSALVLIEEAYASHAKKIEEETDAVIVYLDPLVTGDGALDSYLTGMRKNLDRIRESLSKPGMGW